MTIDWSFCYGHILQILSLIGVDFLPPELVDPSPEAGRLPNCKECEFPPKGTSPFPSTLRS